MVSQAEMRDVGTALVAAAGSAVRTAGRRGRRAAGLFVEQVGFVLGPSARRGVRSLADAVLGQLDLTDLVRRHVDLNAVVATVDLDAVARRIDVDAVVDRVDVGALVDRLDLPTLARQVIEAVDLPEIIRQSSGAMASETVQGLRLHSIGADERVKQVVDRVLLRGRDGPVGGAPKPGEVGS